MNRSALKLTLIFIEIIIVIALAVINLNMKHKTTTALANPVATQTPIAQKIIPTATPQVETITETSENATAEESNALKKDTYTIAAIGDSMVDTMGDSLEFLQPEMRKKYPGINFVFYNYGIGSENVTEALQRFDERYSYQNKNYPPLAHINADVVIVGSYAYNPLYKEGENHWLKLAELIQKVETVSPKVYVLAEIAPLRDGFGVGDGGVNWPPEIYIPHVEKIITGLNDAIGLSKVLDVGLIDVFNEAKNADGYGIEQYVSTYDGIHPSVKGHELTAKIIADTISLDP